MRWRVKAKGRKEQGGVLAGEKSESNGMERANKRKRQLDSMTRGSGVTNKERGRARESKGGQRLT